jgi:hypothetical protein
MARSQPLDPPRTPLSDGVVVLRLRRAADLDVIAAASEDAKTRRWLDDRPMDEAARRSSLTRVEEAWCRFERVGTRTEVRGGDERTHLVFALESPSGPIVTCAGT